MATECMYNQAYADHLMSLINDGKTDNEPLYKAIMAIFNLTVKLLEDLQEITNRNWQLYKQNLNNSEEENSNNESSDLIEVKQKIIAGGVTNKNDSIYSEEALSEAFQNVENSAEESNKSDSESHI